MKVVDLTAARAERLSRPSPESGRPLERLMADLGLPPGGAPSGDAPSIDPYLQRMDPQTGVLSRVALQASLDRSSREQDEDDRGGTLMGFRVDGLSAMHEISEAVVGEVLGIVARRLDRCTRLDDSIGRAGEDRFAVYLRGCSDREAREVAGRCMRSVEERPVRTEGRSFPLRLTTRSVIVAPADPRSGADLLHALGRELEGEEG